MTNDQMWPWGHEGAEASDEATPRRSDEGEDAVEERIAETKKLRIGAHLWAVCDMFHLMSHRETGVVSGSGRGLVRWVRHWGRMRCRMGCHMQRT